MLPATYPKRTRLSASSFFFPLPPCLPEMSFTGNNASAWSCCKLTREHSSAAICTLWFRLEKNRIPKRFCCRFFLGGWEILCMKVYRALFVKWSDCYPLIDDLTGPPAFIPSIFSFFLSCMHLLIKQKTKFASVVYTLFPFGTFWKGNKKSLR